MDFLLILVDGDVEVSFADAFVDEFVDVFFVELVAVDLVHVSSECVVLVLDDLELIFDVAEARRERDERVDELRDGVCSEAGRGCCVFFNKGVFFVASFTLEAVV
ncbi:MAG TPA: hypothetical protein PLO50_00910 [Nitrospira sp.]|nr:hypothetical protein [Nitrospira sp.]